MWVDAVLPKYIQLSASQPIHVFSRGIHHIAPCFLLEYLASRDDLEGDFYILRYCVDLSQDHLMYVMVHLD